MCFYVLCVYINVLLVHFLDKHKRNKHRQNDRPRCEEKVVFLLIRCGSWPQVALSLSGITAYDLSVHRATWPESLDQALPIQFFKSVYLYSAKASSKVISRTLHCKVKTLKIM